MITATITSKGQITIPKNIREQIDLYAGDKVSFIEDEDGSINFVPVKKPLGALKGLVTKKKKRSQLKKYTTPSNTRHNFLDCPGY